VYTHNGSSVKSPEVLDTKEILCNLYSRENGFL